MARLAGWMARTSLAVSLALALGVPRTPLAEQTGGDAAAEAATSADLEQTAEAVPGHAVMLDGEEVFRVYPDASVLGPEESVRRAEATLLAIANDPFYAPDLLEVRGQEDTIAIYYRGQPVGHAPRESQHYESAERRAHEVVESVRAAVERYREGRSPRAWARVGLFLFGASALLALAIWGIFALRLRVAKRLDESLSASVAKTGTRVGFRERLRAQALLLRFVLLVSWVLIALLALVYLQTAFALVPITRGYALAVLDYVLDPLRTLWQSFLANVGDLFFVVVMAYLTRLLLRGLRALFVEAQRGTITLPNVDRDHALSIYKIVRLVVLAMAGVMIYPYIPGSGSAAFQGVSIFAGAVFTLGASSTAANYISGLTLVFSSAFRRGDLLRISEVLGTVEDSTLSMLRLRTPKNEIVTFSNATVMSTGFTNYSQLARGQGVIANTSVTIGYDVPWRTVHALLIAAAKRTRYVQGEPEPFVLQTALNDFHVGYQINAYTREASRLPWTLSELHQNIQDEFAAAGIEILSPTYGSLRDGSPSTVPALPEAEADGKAR